MSNGTFIYCKLFNEVKSDAIPQGLKLFDGVKIDIGGGHRF